jgi:hypothetical protein
MSIYGLGINALANDVLRDKNMVSDWKSSLINVTIGLDTSGFIISDMSAELQADLKWVHFSFPFEPDTSLERDNMLDHLSKFTSYDPGLWRLFKWSSHDWQEYAPVKSSSGKYVDPSFVAECGRGYWITSNGIEPKVEARYGATTARAGKFIDGSYGIGLDSGWNDVGLPYGYFVRFGDILDATVSYDSSLDSGVLYFYRWDVVEQSYKPVVADNQESLEWKPFLGYTVFSRISGKKVLIPPVISSNSRYMSKVLSGGLEVDSLGWRLELVAEGEHGRDRYNYAGYGVRILQMPDPVNPGGVNLWFSGEDERLCYDRRVDFADGSIWDFGISGSGNGVEFHVKGLDSLSDSLEVWVDGGLYGCAFNLRKQEKVPLGLRKGLGEGYRLLVGTRDFIRKNLRGRKVPSAFGMSQNYPNPFNPVTVIRYAIPIFDGVLESHVELEVFNVLGQRVKELKSGVSHVGYHKVMWGGDDSRGRHVGSGVYFYRLRVMDAHNRVVFSKIRKMTLVK